MTPFALIYTTLLMGSMLIAAGAYGGLYALNKLWPRRGMLSCARVCYLIAAALAGAIILTTPLTPGWKLLILVSALVYAIVPPLTWRFLIKLHAAEGHAS
ncbi:MAG: hypothetical protein ACRESA_02310 [Gammaproteobacteria bacterium]